MNMHNKQ